MHGILYNYEMAFNNQAIFLRAQLAPNALNAPSARIGSVAELEEALGIRAAIGLGGPGAPLDNLQQQLADKEAQLAGAGAGEGGGAGGMQLVQDLHKLSNQVNMLKLFEPPLADLEAGAATGPRVEQAAPQPERSYVRVIDSIYLYAAELFPGNPPPPAADGGGRAAAPAPAEPSNPAWPAWTGLRDLEDYIYGCEAMEEEVPSPAMDDDSSQGSGYDGDGGGEDEDGVRGAGAAGPQAAARVLGAGAGADVDAAGAVGATRPPLAALSVQDVGALALEYAQDVQAAAAINRHSWERLWNAQAEHEAGSPAGTADVGGVEGQGGGNRHTRKRKASSTRPARRTRRKRRSQRRQSSRSSSKGKPRRRTISRKPVRGKRGSRKR